MHMRWQALNGPAFWKAPAIQYPAHNEDEPYVFDARSYDETTYNQWNALWSSAGSSAAAVDSSFASFMPAFNGSYKLSSGIAEEESVEFRMALAVPDEGADSVGTLVCADGNYACDPRCLAGNQNTDFNLAQNRTAPLYHCGPKHLSALQMDQTLVKTRTRIIQCACGAPSSSSPSPCEVAILKVGAPIERIGVENCEGIGSPEDPSEQQVWLRWTDGAGTLGSAAYNATYGGKAIKREWGRYWKTTKDATSVGGTAKGFKATRVEDPSEIPASLRQNEYAGPMRGPAEYQAQAFTDDDYAWVLRNEDTFCWACRGKELDGCDKPIRSLVREDGGTTFYRWYRWSDQPAWRQLRREFSTVYTDAYMAELQLKIEAMHRRWPTVGDWGVGKSRPGQFLRRPKSVPNMAEVERALLVDPKAAGIDEYGWVPIAIAHTYPAFGGSDPSTASSQKGSFEFTYANNRPLFPLNETCRTTSCATSTPTPAPTATPVPAPTSTGTPTPAPLITPTL